MILGIGSPLLDSTISVEESFLEEHGLIKGTMSLVDEALQTRLLESIDTKTMTSSPGGSVANALASASAIGGSTLFLGCIGEDIYGDIYEEGITHAKIESSLVRSKTPTGKCLVFITPDGERTFATFLGAALDIEIDTIDAVMNKDIKILFIEGYQFDGDNNAKAVQKAITLAKEKGMLVAIDFSDPGVVQRHFDTLNNLTSKMDFIFANEVEAEAFTKTKDLEAAAKEIASKGPIAIVKNGGKGSMIAKGEELITIDAVKTTVVNTNGAGDSYAGAFLQSFLQGKTLEECGSMASKVGAIAVSREEAMLNAKSVEHLL